MRNLTLIIFIFLFNCSQENKTKVVLRHNNGSPNVIVHYYDNNDTLTFKKEVFYENGNLHYAGEIINGNKEGIWTWWYENGNKKDQCKFKNGIEIDTIFNWYENGNIKQIGIILEGKLNPKKECSVCCNIKISRFYEDGKPKESFTSINDKFEGEYYTYFKNSSWNMKTYKAGTITGKTIEQDVDSNGIIEVTVYGQYLDGKEEGEWSWYNKDSILFQTITYTNGNISSEN